jgi:Uncharacterized conserved protein (DUF2075)
MTAVGCAAQLVPEVRVGDWSIPWNARDGVGRLGPGLPKSDFWASDKQGIDQVGCVYTAQGFEFDYVGVIFGPDLVYRPMDGGCVGQRDQSHDRVVRRGVTEVAFRRVVKSTYRAAVRPHLDAVRVAMRAQQLEPAPREHVGVNIDDRHGGLRVPRTRSGRSVAHQAAPIRATTGNQACQLDR